MKGLRGLAVNLWVSLGLLSALVLLALSKVWWQVVPAAALCAFFTIWKVRVYIRTMKDIWKNN